MPQMQFVDSSNIESIGYEASTSELHVRFQNGSEYVYADVPEGYFVQFLEAPSKGSFLNREIKGVYSYHKI